MQPHLEVQPNEQYLVRIDAAAARLEGQLVLPPHPRGVVLFAHGSGSSRHSPRNQFVAYALRRDASVATLLVDLLSGVEEAIDAKTAELRFDITLLACRLVGAADWLAHDLRTRGLPLGLFGTTTGAAAALVTATERPEQVTAVVSRGGRPDLAGAGTLAKVRAPTLLIVGSEDSVVLDLNQQAQRVLRSECRLALVERAGHLFQEPGTLDEVGRLAAEWFQRHLGHSA